METLEAVSEKLKKEWDPLPDDDPQKETLARQLRSMGFHLSEGVWEFTGTDEC